MGHGAVWISAVFTLRVLAPSLLVGAGGVGRGTQVDGHMSSAAWSLLALLRPLFQAYSRRSYASARSLMAVSRPTVSTMHAPGKSASHGSVVIAD